jgi:signal peptidase I
LLDKTPSYGDLVVFKTPVDNRTDYIKRLIGLPGDTIQFKDGKIFLNKKEILKKKIKTPYKIRCGEIKFDSETYLETMPNDNEYIAAYRKVGTMQNTDEFKVPLNHYFFLGDNRDCSKDSRFLSSVGFVSSENLVGKAKIIFFSNDTISGSIFKFWNWNNSLRIERFFKILK